MDEQTQELVMVQPEVQPQVGQPAKSTFPFGGATLAIGIFVVLGGILFFIVYSHIFSSSASQRASSQPPQPQVKTVDFSPDVPLSQKVSLLIEKNDSSMEKVLIQKDLVQGYIQSLPPGYRVVSQKTAQ